MKKLFVLAFTLLPLAMFAQKSFSINGNVNGLRNGSKIYLTYQDGSDLTDSTWVSNGVFAFKGELSEPVKATLSLNKNDAQGEVLDITTLYLEPAVINVNGAESLREASISGSVITDDYRQLTSLTKPIYDKLAAINAEYGRFTQAQKDDSKLMDEIRNRYTAAEAGLPDILLDYATNNPGSYVSLDAIKQVAGNDDRVMEAESPFYKLDPNLQASKTGINLTKTFEIARKTAIGAQAMDFTLNDANGRAVSLSDFRGKYVFLHFWASWCGPCHGENKYIVAAYNNYKDKNFTIFGVSLDRTRDRWLKGIANDGLIWTEVTDLKAWDSEVAKQYGIKAIPNNFLIDPTGKIIAKNLREERLEQKLAEVLNSNTVIAADNTPPLITITDPEVTRGLKVVQSGSRIVVSGTATDESGIKTVEINGIVAAINPEGIFFASVPLAMGDNRLKVKATDNKLNAAEYDFVISRSSGAATAPQPVPIAPVNAAAVNAEGKYYALIIGIQDYNDESIPDLDRPVADAASLQSILVNNYTFDRENISFLKNPTRDQLFDALESMARKVEGTDNLLIFYAGHGYWDAGRSQGYWFPSDARRLNRSSWLTNADLKEYISAIPSKHTLLITDACFAGGIFKSRAVMAGASRAVKELYNLPSRKAMTSGTLKEVPDKSVFIEYLVKRLNQNTGKYLSAEQLFSSFRTAVINNSANGQVPQFGEIKEAGDEGGDFIFIKRQ